MGLATEGDRIDFLVKQIETYGRNGKPDGINIAFRIYILEIYKEMEQTLISEQAFTKLKLDQRKKDIAFGAWYTEDEIAITLLSLGIKCKMPYEMQNTQAVEEYTTYYRSIERYTSLFTPDHTAPLVTVYNIQPCHDGTGMHWKPEFTDVPGDGNCGPLTVYEIAKRNIPKVAQAVKTINTLHSSLFCSTKTQVTVDYNGQSKATATEQANITKMNKRDKKWYQEAHVLLTQLPEEQLKNIEKHLKAKYKPNKIKSHHAVYDYLNGFIKNNTGGDENFVSNGSEYTTNGLIHALSICATILTDEEFEDLQSDIRKIEDIKPEDIAPIDTMKPHVGITCGGS